MKRRDIALLFGLSLAARLAVAVLISRPGYMDAAYYAAGAIHLAEGSGLNEPFIWNYLDDPSGIPHAGFLYWMPLPSLLAAPLAALFPASFLALQLPFVLLSALLPLVGYGLAWEATGRRRSAWVAGLVVLFSGFFFPYWTLPETFAPFALFGSVALWLAGMRRQGDAETRRRGDTETRGHGDAGTRGHGERWIQWVGCGVWVGLAHLTRADGPLLLVVVLLPVLWRVACGVWRVVCGVVRDTHHAPRTTLHASRFTFHASRFTFHASRFTFHIAAPLFITLGYLLVMSPWFIRNQLLIGAPLSPAGTRTLWLTTYDDLFCYHCDLSLRAYLDWGWGNILASKLQALGTNLQRFLAEDCLVFLFPFVLIGLYRLRRRMPFALAGIYLLLLYLVHSLAFTLPGMRGGFFHSAAALLPFLAAAGAEGLDAAVAWAARHRRGWNARQAQRFFAAAAVALAILLSLTVTLPRLRAWQEADQVYRQVGAWLDSQGVPRNSVVMVANPPAFLYHGHRPAVAVPNGDVATLLEVADRYAVAYVLLDPNRPGPLAGLYHGEESSPRLRVIATWEEGTVVLYTVDRTMP